MNSDFILCVLFLLNVVYFVYFLVRSTEFVLLMKQARESQHHAFSEGSHSNLRSQFRSYFAYCIYFEREPLPADLDTVTGYAQFLSRSLKHGTIRNYLSGVKMLHILCGFPYPFTGNAILKLLLRGIHRLNPYIPQRAPPVVPSMLLAVFRILDHQNSLECTSFACALLLFFTMSRLGSVLPSSSKTVPGKIISADRVNVCEAGLLVTFLHTKTIQFGERILHIPLARSDSPLCPVAAFSHACSFFPSPAPQSARLLPAFRYCSSSGVCLPLYAPLFISTMRQLFARADIADSASYRGHSFRRGGASWAFNNGVPGELVQAMGDWKSDAYKVYLEFSMSSKLVIAQRLATCLPS